MSQNAQDPMANKETALGGAPEPDRRETLARLYSALAAELVAWKEKHPRTQESEVDAAERPVVTRLHETIYKHVGTTRPGTDLGDAALEEANKVLSDCADRLGGVVYTLEPAQVTNLADLMARNHNFRSMAPYKPASDRLGW